MKKFVSLLLALVLVVGALGCSSGDNSSQAQDSSTGGSSTSGDSADSAGEESQAETEEFTYPLAPNADGSLATITMNKDDFVREDLPDYTIIDGKSYYYADALEEATGIHVDWIGSPSNPQATSEAANLLIVSGEYPDVWRVNWVTHPGGPTGALNDGLILNLNEYSEYCPNLFAYYDERPDVKKLVVNDDGDMYCFPYMIETDAAGTWGLGAGFRTDWLADAGLELPSTVDEWTEALQAFVDMGKGGLSFEARWLWLENSAANLSNAFDTMYGFYVRDGQVQYGVLDEGYGEFIGLLADWYANGLLDPDFATVDKSTVKAKWANSEYGAVMMHAGDIENGIIANEGGDPFECDTVPPMVMNEGDSIEFGHFNAKFNGGFMHSVSPGENQEIALRWCDYLYSDAGRKLTSFGTEGITWEADEDGNWKNFTDLVMNNTETTDSPSTIVYNFGWKSNWGYPQMPEVRDYFNSDFVNKANEDFASNMTNYYYPTVTHTEEEADLIATTYSDIETFVQEGIMRFILGTDSMDNWDSFTEQIRGLGIDEVIAAKQAAYDRFMSR